MTAVLRSGLSLVRREPALWLVVFAILIAPAILGGIPIGQALQPLLDMRPAAHSLVESPMDDALVAELVTASPGLPGVALSGALIALVIGVPAMWLASAWIAARALTTSLPAHVIAARGLAVMIALLPLRLVPMGLAVLLGMHVDGIGTLAGAAPWLTAATLVYALGSAKLTIVADLARGFALVDPERRLRSVIADAIATGWRRPGLFLRLVAVELALALVCLGSVLVTRPLGVYTGAAHVLGLGALLLRAFGTAALITGGAIAACSARSPRMME